MDIVSLCPLRVSGFTWQAHTGAYALTVIVKATFLLEPEELPLASKQEAVCDEETSWDADPRKSIRVPSDRAPYKARADVMLVGHAYAPRRQPVRSLIARIVVGEVDKSIEVWCDRGFRIRDNQLLEGPRFAEMSLAWEHAAGGSDTNNPVGMRFDATPDRYGMVSLPNLQPVGISVSKRSDTFAPVAFGPIGSRWPARVQKLRRYVGGFRDPGWERSALPADFDPGYFQSAPSDQLVDEIRPNERIVLENLHPEHARLVTALPGVRPRAIVDRATGEREEIRVVGDTLWIDTDRKLCCVVWRGRIGLRHAAELGRIAVWVDGMPMVEPSEAGAPEMGSSAFGANDVNATMTLIGAPLTNEAPALPFVPGNSLAPASHPGIAADIARWASSIVGDGTGTLFTPMTQPVDRALPFGPEGSNQSDMARAIPPPSEADATSLPSVPAVLPDQPFRWNISASRDEPQIGFRDPEFESIEAEREELGQARPEVAPPLMIGPLATAEARSQVDEAVPQAPLVAVAPADGGPTTRDSTEDTIDLPIEKTATIAAELGQRKAERTKVLESHGLTESAWNNNEARWDAAMEEEQGRGKNSLRGTYDTAYVKRVEEFRGAVTVEEYAMLVVGMERGSMEKVLGDLMIQRKALIPIMRVWLKAMAQDMKLGRAATKAIREARGA